MPILKILRSNNEFDSIFVIVDRKVKIAYFVGAGHVGRDDVGSQRKMNVGVESSIESEV